jgi:hypothetical protein
MDFPRSPSPSTTFEKTLPKTYLKKIDFFFLLQQEIHYQLKNINLA